MMRGSFRIFLLCVLSVSTALAAHKEKKKKSPYDPSQPVYLDARGVFAYSMAHLEGSFPVRVEDFQQTDESAERRARRLSALGVHPDRVVFVLGEGPRGRGAEGFIGWELAYLGVKDVRVYSFDGFLGKKKSGEHGDTPQAPFWKPQLNANLRMTKAELKDLLKSTALPFQVIDVRVASEWKKEKSPPGSINIPWIEFLDDKGNAGQPSAVLDTLGKFKIDRSKTLIFVDTDGMASAYACLVAHRAGIKARSLEQGLGPGNWE